MDVTTTYLELCTVDGIRSARDSGAEYAIAQVAEPAPEFARFLYVTVGADWSWTDRLGWTREDWQERLALAGVETWVMWVRGAPAGYAELDSRAGEDGSVVELAYFGLLPAYVGRGLGGVLLEAALRRAWAMNEDTARPTARVWVHTCSLDGPHALANYRSRGFQAYRTETEDRSDG